MESDSHKDAQGISNRETPREEAEERRENPPLNPLSPDAEGVAGGSPGDESKEDR